MKIGKWKCPGSTAAIAALSIAALLTSIISAISFRNAERKFGGRDEVSPFTITTRDSGSGPATTTEQFGSILPQTSGLYNLGINGRAWNNITASGTIDVGTITADDLTWTNATGTNLSLTRMQSALNPAANNSFGMGTSALSWTRIFASSTVHAGGVTSTGHINPFINNTYDLGAFTTAWASLYTSGTSYMGPIQVASTTNAVLVGIGTASNPSYSFLGSGNADSGMFLNAGNLRLVDPTEVDLQAGGVVLAHTGTFLGTTGNNQTDLGRVSAAWAQIFASSTIHAGAGMLSAGNVNPTINNTYDLGTNVLNWANLYATSVLFGTGSAGTPALRIRADTDTGIFSTSTNYLSIAAAGRESASFTASAVTTTIDLSSGRTCFILRDNTGVVRYATIGSTAPGSLDFQANSCN